MEGLKMSKVKNSINAWKNSLLDISKRNRAINYKPFKSSTVAIASPNIDDFLNTIETKTMRFVQVFNLIDVKKLDEEKNLYVTSKGMSFPKKDEYTEDEVSKIVNNYNHKNFKDTNIFTPYFDNILTSKLRHLANQSRLFEEENALNILYLGVGMFEWYESLSSAIKYRSPLLFLPVELNQKTISDDFTLTLRENDLMINDALARLMKETFKVDLEFDFDSNLSLSENYSNYKNHLFSLTEANPGWAFLDELNLSIFKFSTISMVKDIEENLETIEKHALIRQLAGDKVKIKKTVDVSDKDIENKKPDEYYQALDADSSQMVAVEEAILGNSFVLQGPPGTGKSQTITNILTELIARGKKVLFVAEKKAALDVVFNNLKKIGLEDYAISLHNTQLDKKQTISELANSLKDRQGRYKKISEASKTALYNKYNHSKELLNSYGNSLIKPREPLHLNLYQLYSSYFSLSKYPELRFKIDNVEKLDNKFLSNVEITLKRLETIESQVGKNFDKSPWSSLKLLKDNYLILEEIDEYVNKLKTEFNKFLEIATILSESLNIKLRDLSLDKLETISQLIDAFDDIKVKNEKVETAILNGEILLERDIYEYDRLLNYLEKNISNKNSLNNYDFKILDEDISMFL